ncbi:SDR family NAD(P)-dependent oxidoreductase [Paracoccaceae bacterium GXU_MW_L88]
MADLTALVVGATGGIGSAVAALLEERGVAVTRLSRNDGLDLTDQASVNKAAEALGDARFDLIFNATGALVIDGHEPEKTIRAIEAEAMAQQFALNAIGVALLLRAFSPLLREDRKAVFASLSARVGSIGDNGLGGWISYRAAKAAQNQILRTASIEIARQNKEAIVVALHPGTVETPLTAKYAANYPTITPEKSAEALLGVIDKLTPEDTGSFWDWKGKRVEW